MAVVTDRGPLDGLVKFDLPPRLRSAGYYAWLADRYDVTLLVETTPATLKGRGWDDAAGSPEAWWARYRLWAARVPRVAPVDGGPAPATVAVRALAVVVSAAGGTNAAGHSRRGHWAPGPT
ncbi:hypothetical protein [Streptomyces sp. NPDC001930]|uniref:hypothetical protein n=1 Tax=Streptomyces sp. NPDC001930 TaxID=3364625 RepID=UPI003697B48A